MGRRVKRFLIIIPAAAVVLLTLLLATCSNEFNIFEAIKTDLKIANDLFLVIKSISPANNAPDVNPSDPIVIEFDRAIDESTLNDTNIIIEKFGGVTSLVWVPIPNQATKTLTISADPYFDSLSKYLVTITKGVKGADASELQEEYVWSFDTKNYPGGTVFFASGDKPYFISSPRTLTINLNDQVASYRCAIINEGDDEIAALNSVGWTTLAGPVTTTVSVPVSSLSDGYKRAYIQVRNASNDIPNPAYDRSFMDVNNPAVSIVSGPTTVIASSNSTQSLDASATDGSGSGFDSSSYAWTVSRLSGSGDLTFANSVLLDTSVYDSGTDADGTFRLRITATDKAGRSGSTTRDVTWDRTAPSLSISGASYDLTSPLSWSWSTTATDLDRYEYSWNSSTFYDIGTATTINKSTSTYGPHVLYLRAYDDIDNLTSRSYTTYYSPSTIYPYWGQRNVPVDGFTFDWPTYSGMIYTYSYDFYIYDANDPKPKTPTIPGLTASELLVPAKSSYLDTRTQYNWFYKVYYGAKIKTYVYTSDTFTFWTKLF